MPAETGNDEEAGKPVAARRQRAGQGPSREPSWPRGWLGSVPATWSG